MSSLLSFYTLYSLQSAHRNIQNIFDANTLNVSIHFEALDLGFVCFCVIDQPLNQQVIDGLVEAISQQCSADADILYFPSVLQLANIGLIAFDMDSTLIQAEVIDELARYADAQTQVADITAAAMRGEISFDASFEQRIKLLAGIDAPVLANIAQQLPYMPGLQTVFSDLKSLNIKTAIISGGFQYFADYLKDILNADYAFANRLEIHENMLTGAYQGEILGPEKKRTILTELAQQENVALDHCMAVGDGANDLFMLQAAGVGVAFHAKPALKEKSAYSLDVVSLDALSALLIFCRQYK